MSNAYGYQPQAAPPPKSGGALKVILIILGVLLVLCCGGVGVTAYLLYSGAKVVAAEVAKQAVINTPEAQEAIGEIQSVSVDLSAKTADIQGSKGSGKALIRDDGSGAELKMSDGRVIPLTLPDAEHDAHQPDVKMPELHSTETTTEADATEEAESPAPAP